MTLTCIFLITNWIIFCIWYGESVLLRLFACGYPAPFAEKTVLSPIKWSWCPCGSQFTIYVWVYFWILNFIPLIYMSILEPVSPCFDYYCFVVNFEIGKCEFSYFALFQDCFGYSGPWKLNMNFTIMSTFIKILPGILFFCWICRSVWGVLLS